MNNPFFMSCDVLVRKRKKKTCVDKETKKTVSTRFKALADNAFHTFSENYNPCIENVVKYIKHTTFN